MQVHTALLVTSCLVGVRVAGLTMEYKMTDSQNSLFALGVAMPGLAIVVSAVVETLSLPERSMREKGKQLGLHAMTMVTASIVGFFTFVILYQFGRDTESHLNTDYDTNAMHPPYVGNGGL